MGTRSYFWGVVRWERVSTPFALVKFLETPGAA